MAPGASNEIMYVTEPESTQRERVVDVLLNFNFITFLFQKRTPPPLPLKKRKQFHVHFNIPERKFEMEQCNHR